MGAGEQQQLLGLAKGLKLKGRAQERELEGNCERAAAGMWFR